VTVAELIAALVGIEPRTPVTVIDPHLHIDCHPKVSVEQWVVSIESTGRIVTEQDVS
jgi:hypothetical protein